MKSTATPGVALRLTAAAGAVASLLAVVSGAIQERMVQTGVTVGDFVEVDDGLKVGDTVVVSPGPDVRDGARVE